MDRFHLKGYRMSPTLKALGIDQLSVEERIALVQEIWDSIAADMEATPLTGAQRAELERRLADHEANPDDVIPWEQIQAEALARFQK
jgi:putative addiction module component (TIGR02574 family)